MNAATRALNPGLFPEKPAAPARTNARNTGKAFEKEIERICGAYHSKRAAIIKKVDPPTRLIWYDDKSTGKKATRVIFLPNPFLDFAGVWTARHARAIFVEAKSTSAHRLPFKRSGGISEEQLAAIKTWRGAGAAVAVLWQFNGEVTLWTPEMLVAAELRGDKSLVFGCGRVVPRGEGSILWDFLPVLEREVFGAPEKISVGLANKFDACE